MLPDPPTWLPTQRRFNPDEATSADVSGPKPKPTEPKPTQNPQPPFEQALDQISTPENRSEDKIQDETQDPAIITYHSVDNAPQDTDNEINQDQSNTLDQEWDENLSDGSDDDLFLITPYETITSVTPKESDIISDTTFSNQQENKSDDGLFANIPESEESDMDQPTSSLDQQPGSSWFNKVVSKIRSWFTP
jgi:hypothetical protein